MYIPKHYNGKDKQESIAFMKRFNFGTIITSIDNIPFATHLPFIIAERDNEIIISVLQSDYSGYGVSCHGETDGFIDISVIGGTENYTYEWSNDQTTEDLNNIGAGTYTVTVTDENGCSESSIIEITETQPMVITEVHSDYNGYGVSCHGATNGWIDITVTGGTENYTFEWMTGSQLEDVDNLGAGTWIVVAYDENLCEVSMEIEITEPDEISASNNESIAIVSEYNGYIKPRVCFCKR